jgi:hypothetical protein
MIQKGARQQLPRRRAPAVQARQAASPIVLSRPVRLQARPAQKSELKMPSTSAVIGGIIGFGLLVEGLLALRLWVQLTPSKESGLICALASLAGIFVAPFKTFDPSGVETKTAGFFEFSTLLAAEFYLISFAIFVVGYLLLKGSSQLFVDLGHRVMKLDEARRQIR